MLLHFVVVTLFLTQKSRCYPASLLPYNIVTLKPSAAKSMPRLMQYNNQVIRFGINTS